MAQTYFPVFDFNQISRSCVSVAMQQWSGSPSVDLTKTLPRIDEASACYLGNILTSAYGSSEFSTVSDAESWIAALNAWTGTHTGNYYQPLVSLCYYWGRLTGSVPTWYNSHSSYAWSLAGVLIDYVKHCQPVSSGGGGGGGSSDWTVAKIDELINAMYQASAAIISVSPDDLDEFI